MSDINRSNVLSFKGRDHECKHMITEDELPTPLTPNIVAPFNYQHAKACALALENQVAIFGTADFNRFRAAATLAGLLIVAASLGHRPVSFHLLAPEKNGASPYQIYSEWNAEYLAIPISANTRPEILMQAAIHSFAGKAGEVMAQLYHNASLISDVYRGSVATVFLDYLYKVPMNTHMHRAIGYTNEVVTANAEVFDQLYAAFCARDEIAFPYLQNLLDQVIPKKWEYLLGALQ